MPPGICNPPVCWDLTFNFGAIGLLVMRPVDVPQWNKGFPVPVNQFQNMVNAFIAQLNAQAKMACGNNCVCVRLHKKAVNINYAPQKIGPHPNGQTDIYMTGITARGWFGLCMMKGWVRIKKGDKWVPVEDLGPSDILTPGSGSPGGSSGGHKKKKGKKRRKAGRKTGGKKRR